MLDKFDMDYNFQITAEMILKLMQGKALNFQRGENEPRFTFYPPASGVFMTDKQYHSLKASSTHGQGHIFHEIENA